VGVCLAEISVRINRNWIKEATGGLTDLGFMPLNT